MKRSDIGVGHIARISLIEQQNINPGWKSTLGCVAHVCSMHISLVPDPDRKHDSLMLNAGRTEDFMPGVFDLLLWGSLWL
jgi:hypothetical protein